MFNMLSNYRAILIGRSLLVVLLSVILIDLVFSQLSGSLGDLFIGHKPAIISSILLVLLIAINPRYFSFSDDHEFIVIQSNSGLWSIFENRAATNFDIPKKYIGDYSVTGWGKTRRLNLDLHTSYREKRKYHFDIAFLSSDQEKRMQQSFKLLIDRPKNKPYSKLATVG